MSKIVFRNSEIAHKHYKNLSNQEFNKFLSKRNLDVMSLTYDTIENLKVKLDQIKELIADNTIIFENAYIVTSDYDFEILNDFSSTKGFYFDLKPYLEKSKEFILERINQLEQTSTVKSIKDLLSELPENEIKNKLESEIKELELKKTELMQIQLEDRERINDEIEIGKHKAEMFEKRTNIFLKFLDRESVASIVGSLLLLIIGVCLIVIMFRHEEPLKIIESAFLLILGYFFGHSKNNK